jgi:hypothetical protein
LLFKSQGYKDSQLPGCIRTAGLLPPGIDAAGGLNLLLTYSLGPSLVFLDLDKEGLNKRQTLAGSGQYDVVTCAWVADLRQDGRPPVLLLGTYGQELLAYGQDSDQSWQLIWQKTFAAPVIGVRYADLTGDGVRELIVITTRGVQVLQHNLSMVKAKALRALQYLVSLAKS